MENQEGLLKKKLKQTEAELGKAREKYKELLSVHIVTEGDRVPRFMKAAEWIQMVTECLDTIARLEKERNELLTELAEHRKEDSNNQER